MSGHSKWSTIKHKKGKADAARGRLFTRLIKEITIAARAGGGSEDSNPRLRTAVLNAKASNMPMDNITRAIKKGTGELEGVAYEDATYEGYGQEGVAILVECVTDSRNRCVAEVRHVLGKFGGKLAEPGSVAWIFSAQGRVEIPAEGVDEEELLMVAMEAGADDLVNNEDNFELLCSPDSVENVRKACEDAGYSISEAGAIKVPSNPFKLEGMKAVSLLRLLEQLETLDDVQDVWANFEMDDSILESMA